MAKDKERRLAEFYYIEKGKTAKEISILINVREATISRWVSTSGWKARREASATSATSRCDNLQQVISELATERIELSRELKNALDIEDTKTANELRKQIASIDDGVSKWNKSLESAKKIATIPLHIYLEVMERIFTDLRTTDSETYLKTIAFQEQHIEKISAR